MPNFNTKDVSLYYEVTGHGPPLLLVAGFMSDSQSWMPVIEGLAAHFMVITCDNRTTGRTQPRNAPTSLTLMGGDCMSLMTHLGVERAHIVGHSMGGIVAMDIAARYPERVDKLVVAATTPDHSAFQMSVLDTVFQTRKTGGGDLLWLRSLLHWLFHPKFFDDPKAIETALANADAYPHKQSLDGMGAQLTVLGTMKDGLDVASIKAQTLALLGSHDLFYPLEEARKSLSNLLNYEIGIVENAGHSLHWDQPDAFTRQVCGFLRT
jgi:pimeloyl-ACP methyl ester carboxylesterase